MEFFYVVVFLVGVFYTLVSLLISGISGAFHTHGDFGGGHVHGEFGHHGHIEIGHGHADSVHLGHVHSDAGHLGDINGAHGSGSHTGDMNAHHGHSADSSSGSNNLLSWFSLILNPLVAVSFLTVFGGMGIMGVRIFKWNDIIVFLAALLTGVVVSAILYNFVAKPIYRSENSTDVSRENLVGTPAEVTTDILANGYGTIKYSVNSIMYTAPAKHIDAKEVKQGEKVFICKIEDNTFYISELSSILK